MSDRNNAERQRLEEDKACRKGFLTVVSLIIGMCTYMYGCNSYVGGLCSRYSTENFLVTSSSYYVHGDVEYQGKNYSCGLETGTVYPTRFQTRVKMHDYYPVGSTHEIQFDTIDGYCKTNEYVSRLGIVGFSFLLLFGLLSVSYICKWCCCQSRNIERNLSAKEQHTTCRVELNQLNTTENALHGNKNACGMCEKSLDKNDEYFHLKCNHSFHKECMETTSNKAGKCPTCSTYSEV